VPRDEGAGVPAVGEASEGGIVKLQIVRGNPTTEELAALIAIVASRSTAAPPPAPVRSLWAQPVLRTALPHGPGAWRASSLPH
jgi:hypothetical protein